MKRCWLSAFGVFVWLLLLPPPKMPPQKNPDGTYQVDQSIPLKNWMVYGKYDSKKACLEERKSKPSYFNCVRSTDSHLKGGSALTAAATTPAPAKEASAPAQKPAPSPAPTK
ncbi:MAG TPA: hypothetical protein VEC38_00165 [Candidatus Binataceae bacterium]|nr:hypothetical protein [Candidatus Binataceae bacterium]